MSGAGTAAGSKAAYIQALRTIANARNSDMLRAQADSPDGPLPVKKGTEDTPVGLENIANTCYLNSLLQYYYTVNPVRDVVMNFDKYRADITDEYVKTRKVGGRNLDREEIEKAQKCA
jgi:ubiquitin carboxyl-terminal hydrolase 25/28